MKIVLLLHTNHISFIQDHFTCCHADGMMETKTWQPNTTLSQLSMIIIISPHYPPHSLHRYQRLARGGGSRRCRLTGGLVPHPFGFHLQRLILSEHCCFWSQHVLTFFSPPDHIISYIHITLCVDGIDWSLHVDHTYRYNWRLPDSCPCNSFLSYHLPSYHFLIHHVPFPAAIPAMSLCRERFNKYSIRKIYLKPLPLTTCLPGRWRSFPIA